LLPPLLPLLRTTNFAPDYNFGAEKLREFENCNPEYGTSSPAPHSPGEEIRGSGEQAAGQSPVPVLLPLPTPYLDPTRKAFLTTKNTKFTKEFEKTGKIT